MMPVLTVLTLVVWMSSCMLTLALQIHADSSPAALHRVSETFSRGGNTAALHRVSETFSRGGPWQMTSFTNSLASKPPLTKLTGKCGKELGKQRAKRQFWRDTVGQNREQHEDRNRVLFSPKYNIGYVFNQKVGTRSFLKLFHVLDKSSYEVWMPYSNSTMLPDQKVVQAFDHTFLFTFIREPVAAAWAAYAEVSHRVPHIVSTPCNAGNRRYKEYLTRLANGTLQNGELFHSWPEALKVDVLSPLGRQAFDFVGQLETVSTDLPIILSMAGVPVEDIDRSMTKLEDIEHPRGSECDRQIQSSHTSSGLDETTWPLICNFYYVDLVCLGYPLPEQCS